MAFVETVRAWRDRIPGFRREKNSSEEGNRFSATQASEIYRFAYAEYIERDERTDFGTVKEIIMGLEAIPTDALRQATIGEIWNARGSLGGKPRDEIAMLGIQFLGAHLGPEEAERISEFVRREVAEAVVDKKE